MVGVPRLEKDEFFQDPNEIEQDGCGCVREIAAYQPYKKIWRVVDGLSPRAAMSIVSMDNAGKLACSCEVEECFHISLAKAYYGEGLTKGLIQSLVPALTELRRSSRQRCKQRFNELITDQEERKSFIRDLISAAEKLKGMGVKMWISPGASGGPGGELTGPAFFGMYVDKFCSDFGDFNDNVDIISFRAVRLLAAEAGPDDEGVISLEPVIQTRNQITGKYSLHRYERIVSACRVILPNVSFIIDKLFDDFVNLRDGRSFSPYTSLPAGWRAPLAGRLPGMWVPQLDRIYEKDFKSEGYTATTPADTGIAPAPEAPASGGNVIHLHRTP